MTRRNTRTALGHFLLPLVLATPAVNVEWKPDTDFSQYHTYDWIGGAHAVDELSQQKIVSAIEDELASGGWWRDDHSPDLHLSYYASTKDEVTIDSPYRTSWYDDATIRVRRIHEGTLMLDMVDAAENVLVWRGIVTEALSDDTRRNDSQIADTIRKLLEGFPPE